MNFYIPHRRTLNDSAGLAVERGSPDAPDVVESFGPRDVLPDYILGPPTDLNWRKMCDAPHDIQRPSDVYGEILPSRTAHRTANHP
ncbi:putative adhesin [Streptomyces sp. NPDC056672]|uniref:putative adhesin n=1 Tax=Streptomyces sp. NPDC056672 TaxID=3345906 RepID=UPI003687B649